MTTSANSLLAMKSGLWGWIVKHGIPYALVQAPMIAIMLGYFWRVMNYPEAVLVTIFLAFGVLPAYLTYRAKVSDDPGEPAHHFHRYALYALIPLAVYNLARLPMYYLWDTVYWDRWFDFGSVMTGAPHNQYESFVPGTIIHVMQGYALGFGYYLLFRRHSLINALLSVFLALSLIYVWVYPMFIQTSFPPTLEFYFVAFWSHFWMAIAAWAAPKTVFSRAFWDRLGTARGPAFAAFLGIWILPLAFAVWRTETWQFPRQTEIDNSAIEQVKFDLLDGPILVGVEGTDVNFQQARYQFTLALGPLRYANYRGRNGEIHLDSLSIRGHLVNGEEIVAWCFHQLHTDEDHDAAYYYPMSAEFDGREIVTDCFGPAQWAESLEDGDELTVYWSAAGTVSGDREFRVFNIENQRATLISIPAQFQTTSESS